MVEPRWELAVARYRVPRRLATRARGASFEVVSAGPALLVTPSSGHPRRITEREWELAVPLLNRAGRAALTEATFNSSYLEAIVEDLRRP
jgi:hypothetical protein